MKNLLLTALLIFGATMLLPAGSLAQDVPTEPQRRARGRAARPNVLRQLGLTPDQNRQIRELNRARRPAMEAAQRALGEANAALDDAIYADVINENEIAVRLEAYQKAQAEVSRIRSMHELDIRRVLTPEQFAKFKEIRMRFAENRRRVREEFRERRRNRIDPAPNN